MLGLYLKIRCSDTASCASPAVLAINLQGWLAQRHPGKENCRLTAAFSPRQSQAEAWRHHPSTEPAGRLPQGWRELYNRAPLWPNRNWTPDSCKHICKLPSSSVLLWFCWESSYQD